MERPPPEFPLDVEVPQDMGAALRAIADPEFLHSQKWQEQQWRAERFGAHPDVLEFERVMIKRMAKLGVPMFSPEVMRSSKRQDQLYTLGNSKARGGQSPHQYGCAVDIVHSVKGWGMSELEWRLIGHVGQELIQQKGLAIESFVWGGNWKFYDPAHWQLRDWKALKGRYPWPKE